MRKLFALVLSAVMLISITACGNSSADPNDPIIGEWEMTAMNAGGVTMTMEEIAVLGVDMSIEIDMKADGKLDATVAQGGQTETSDGKWEANGDNYSVTLDGETVDATLTDGKLSMEIEGSEAIFEKK